MKGSKGSSRAPMPLTPRTQSDLASSRKPYSSKNTGKIGSVRFPGVGPQRRKPERRERQSNKQSTDEDVQGFLWRNGHAALPLNR